MDGRLPDRAPRRLQVQKRGCSPGDELQQEDLDLVFSQPEPPLNFGLPERTAILGDKRRRVHAVDLSHPCELDNDRRRRTPSPAQQRGDDDVRVEDERTPGYALEIISFRTSFVTSSAKASASSSFKEARLCARSISSANGSSAGSEAVSACARSATRSKAARTSSAENAGRSWTIVRMLIPLATRQRMAREGGPPFSSTVSPGLSPTPPSRSPISGPIGTLGLSPTGWQGHRGLLARSRGGERRGRMGRSLPLVGSRRRSFSNSST